MPTSNAPEPSVLRVVGSCTRSLGLWVAGVVGVVALITGLVLAAPHVAEAVSDGWYRWARWMTDGYTALKAPTLIFWGSLLTMLWSGCITGKLINRTPSTGAVWAFMGLTFVALVAGMIPAGCALSATAADWNFDWVLQQNDWLIAGTLTYYGLCAMGYITAFAAFCGFMFLLMEAQARA